jgi:hypothetical protein
MEAFDQSLRLSVGLGIESLARMSIARQESFQAKDIAIIGIADDDGASDARFKQTDPAQNKGAHDPLTQLGLFHQKIRDSVRGNDQGFHGAPGYRIDQSRPARKLGQLAPKRTRAVSDDGIVGVGVIALGDDDLTRKDEEHARTDLPGLRQIFSRPVDALLAEAVEALHLSFFQRREHLFAACLEYRNLR